MTVIVNGRAYYAKGERVRLSAAGRATYCDGSPFRGGRHGKKTDWATRLGTVANRNYGLCVTVRWDGNRTGSSIHKSYIERADLDDVNIPTTG